MAYLSIFDIKISQSINSPKDINNYIPLFKAFHSQFWFQRQWFFGHGIYYQNEYRGDKGMGLTMTLYSINPYR